MKAMEHDGIDQEMAVFYMEKATSLMSETSKLKAACRDAVHILNSKQLSSSEKETLKRITACVEGK